MPGTFDDIIDAAKKTAATTSPATPPAGGTTKPPESGKKTPTGDIVRPEDGIPSGQAVSSQFEQVYGKRKEPIDTHTRGV